MPNTIQYPKNPNIETAFVVQNDGTKNRALMIAPQDISTLELPSNPNSTKGYVTINSKKQRVLLTADISGNGGGSVDYDRVIEKTDTIPSVSDVDVGKVYMYTGASNASYTHGYIYECVATQTASAVAFTGNIISSWAVADFVTYLQDGGSAYDEVTHGSLTYDLSGDLWTLVGLDENNIIVMTLKESTQDLLDAGCTFVGTPQDGDTCDFTLTTTASGKKWKQLDVQPGGGSGGAVDSVNGKTGTVVLTASDVGALENTATGAGSSGINEVASSSVTNTTGSNSVIVGGYATARNNVVSVGSNNGGATYQMADYTVLVGTGNQASGNYGIAIGTTAKSAYCSISIGKQVNVTASYAIQLGCSSTFVSNTDANTFKVANNNGNFEIMSADGTMPTDRFTTTPVADGTYVPTLTIVSGVATRSWAAPGGGGSVPTLTWYSVSTPGSTLTITDTSSAQLVKIYKNGLLLQPTDDYTISGTTLTMTTALVVGDKITTEVF